MSGVTRHAKKRIRRRIGTKQPEKQFQEALENGTHQRDTKGQLRSYLGRRAMKNMSSYVIYKGFVYWHKNYVLLTVTPLPQKFLKYLRPKAPAEKNRKQQEQE